MLFGCRKPEGELDVAVLADVVVFLAARVAGDPDDAIRIEAANDDVTDVGMFLPIDGGEGSDGRSIAPLAGKRFAEDRKALGHGWRACRAAWWVTGSAIVSSEESSISL